MTVSNKPFPEALRGLMESRSVSYRKLSELIAAGGGKLSHTYLQQLTGKRSKPTTENMEQIAVALGVEPVFFREYREHVAARRAAVLAAQLGLDVVMAKLAELDQD